MRTNQQKLYAALLKGSACTVLLSAAALNTAYAQDQVEQDQDAFAEEIVITGSRIAKPGLVSNSPIATVDAEEFRLTGTVNVESLLNDLPQVIPGLTSFSNNPGDGTATVDLRGLGATRTLVMVDGTRWVPANEFGRSDLNTIPSALIERVEVVTGGASAVYGSDAVAGVVNFILKKDFEGVEVNSQYRITARGDAQVKSADLTVGGNFGDGRGNVIGHIGYVDRETLFADGRSFSAVAANQGLCAPGSLDGNGFGTAAPAPEPGADDNRVSCFTPGGSSSTPEGVIFDPALPSGISFTPDGEAVAFGTNGTGPYNFAPDNFLQIPQERFLIMSMGHYEVFEGALDLFYRGTYSSNQVPQQLAPTPYFSLFNTPIDLTVENPLYTESARAALRLIDAAEGDNDGIVTVGDIRRRLEEVGPRFSGTETNSWQIQFGARGELFGGLNYETYYQQSQLSRTDRLLNDVSTARLQEQLLVAVDNEGNVQCSTNVDSDGNFVANTGCVPIDLFGAGAITEEAAAYLRLNGLQHTRVKRDVFAFTLSGDTGDYFELPGGAIGYAVGYEYRREAAVFTPDDAFQRGTIAGFNAAQALAGKFDVHEFFAEVNVPLLSGLPFAEYAGLNGAVRVSDYSTAGTATAWKAEAEWVPVEGVRFRGGFSRAVRAPSVGELFAAQGQGFPPANDPCAGGNPVGDAALTAICVATGVPQGAIGNVPALAAGQVQQITGGNPDLFEESADTYTIGAVLTPTFLPNFSISVDYYNIEIEDAISTFGGGAANIINTCYTRTRDASDPFCSAISRSATGAIISVSSTNANIATISTAGIDVEANYSFDVDDLIGSGSDWGSMRLRWQGTWVDKNTFQADPISPVQDCSGLFGDTCGEPDSEIRWTSSAQWVRDKVSALLRVRWQDSVINDGRVDFTDEGREIADSSDIDARLGARTYIDLSASYDVLENVTLTGGVENLLDKKPRLTDEEEQSNTYPSTYDVLGTRFFIGAQFRF